MIALKKSISFYLVLAGLVTLLNVTVFASRALEEQATSSQETVIESVPEKTLQAFPDEPTLTLGELAKTGEIYRLSITGEGWTSGHTREFLFFDDRIHEKLSLSASDECGVNCRPDHIDAILQIPSSIIPGNHRLAVVEEGTSGRADIAVAIPSEWAGSKAGEEKITIINPPVATADVATIIVRGLHWGPYAQRRDVRAWLLNPEKPEIGVELRVSRNYSDDELFLAVELTDEARALPRRDYLLYVITNAGQEAAAPFALMEKRDLSAVAKPTIVLTPNKGPVRSYVVVIGAGFPSRSGVVIRLDGVALPRTLVTDGAGAFDNVGVIIPRTLTKDNRLVVLTQGLHTIEVDAGDGKRAQATFDIMEEDGDALTKAEKEKIATEEKKKQEQGEKDEYAKKKLEEELKKKTDELAALKKKSGKNKSFFEPQKKIDALKQKKSALEKKIGMELFFGKPCTADFAITFQPGCIPPLTYIVPTMPFAGKPCDALLPRVWQQGCTAASVADPAVQYYAKDAAGKPCRADLAITFQPGCIAPAAVPKEPASSAGKKCDPLVPSYAQKGCVPR